MNSKRLWQVALIALVVSGAALAVYNYWPSLKAKLPSKP